MLRTCYSGFGRGLIVEVINLLAVVSVTALACNFYAWLAQLAVPWWHGDPGHLQFVIFAILLLTGILVTHLMIRRVVEVSKNNRLHWTLECVGMMVGGARGLWWTGVLLLMLLSLGVPYLTDSIEERSIAAPWLEPHAKQIITTVVDQFPGAMHRPQLFPSVTLKLPKFPDTKIDL